MPHTNSMARSESSTFTPALRIHGALTAPAEKRLLQWMARRAPRWLTSDQLTAFALLSQIGAGVCYGIARFHRGALLAVIVCIAGNWLGDSLDGTLARVRNQLRPRYGFYVDHIVDLFGTVALMVGMACSGFLHWPVAAAMLVAFLLLSSESYLTTYTLGRFEMSQYLFGPTELRLLLVAGNLALLRSSYSTVFHHKMLLFDLGGSIAAVCMVAMLLTLTLRHTAQLFREEPLP